MVTVRRKASASRVWTPRSSRTSRWLERFLQCPNVRVSGVREQRMGGVQRGKCDRSNTGPVGYL